MTVSEEVRRRVADLVELQPTKNKALQERWDLDSGSAVHGYLESELSDYYYRDDDSLIRATRAAEELVGGSGGPVPVTGFQDSVLAVLPEPDDDPVSVVATLHSLENAGVAASVERVRSALRALVDRGLVEEVKRTVPTYRLVAARTELSVTVTTGDPDTPAASDGSGDEEATTADRDGSVDDLVVDMFEDESV